METRKILHIIYAKEWGGGESCAYLMSREAAKNGADVFIVLDQRLAAFENRFSEFATVSCMNLNRNPLLLNAVKVGRLLEREKINIIHIHTGKVLPLAVFARKLYKSAHIIVFRHNLLANKQDGWHKFLYRQVDRFVCVSKAVWELQRNSAPPSCRDKFSLVYNGIDTAQCRPVYKKTVPQPPRLVLGYAGRIVPNKGLSVLLEALMLLESEDIHLKIAGDDKSAYASSLKRSLADSPLKQRVQWLGFQQDMAEFYNQIDVFVMPSLVKEAFGLVLCEAMLFEKPVISTTSGAQGEIVDQGENGVLVSPGSITELVSAIRFFAGQQELIRQYGQAGKAKVEKYFTMKVWQGKMEAVYAEVAGSK